MDYSPCSTGTVATVRACSQCSSDSVTAQVETPTCLEQSPMRRKRPGFHLRVMQGQPFPENVPRQNQAQR